MAVSFPIPSAHSKSVITIDNFLGADFTNSPANVDDNKSPNLKNLIRDVPGKVRKCMGYETVESYTDYERNCVDVFVGDDNEYEDDVLKYTITDHVLNITFYKDANDEHYSFGSSNFNQTEMLFLWGMYFNCNMLPVFTADKKIPSWITDIRISKYQDRYYFDFTFDGAKAGDETSLRLRTFPKAYIEDLPTSYLFNEGTVNFTVDNMTVDINDHAIRMNKTGNTSYVDIKKKAYLVNQEVAKKYVDFGEKYDIYFSSLFAHLFPSSPVVNGISVWVAYDEDVAADENNYYARGRIIDDAPYDTGYITLEVFSNPEDLLPDKNKRFAINGFHKLRKDDLGIVHAGTTIFRDGLILYEGANNRRSKSWEFDEHLYIIDGKKLLRYGLDGEESDTKYKEDKTTNNVVVNEEVTLVVKRFNAPNYSLTLRNEQTTSPNGHFTVSEDKRVITYTDTISNVGDDVTYSCGWSYKKKSSSSTQTGSMTEHHLVGVTDEKTYTVVPVETDAYTPLVTISKDPEGGGEPYEDINLLNPAFKEQFLGKPNVTEYNLSFTELDETEPIVEVLNADGEWEEWEYGTDYTCDYEQGIITFTRAPGESPVTGEDNIRVTAYRTVDDYADRINKCTIGALFGVSGAMDRLFLSGNPDYINYDWYSAQYDPTYFADTSYSVLGSSGSAIIGYSIVSNYLAAHKDKYERDQNIILREGDLVESEPSFRIINTLQGAGAVAPFSFAYLATEPLFLTNQGVYAVTAQDVTGEKYAQNRSYFLDGKLLEEENLADAYGFVYNDMYWLCLNDVAYILDGLQPIQTDKSMPYATRQYVGFYRTNLPAYTMWENDGRLFFGTDDGKICRFFKDKYALESYNDDGEPIECIWETPDIIGKLFFKNKTLSHVAIKLDSAIAASVSIYVMNRGIWEFVRTDHWRARIFQFSKEVFSKHTFSCDKTQKVLPKKLRVKKVDKFRLRLTNNELNESFALYDIGFEYTETSNYMR